MTGHCRECDEIREDLDELGSCWPCRDRAEKKAAKDERLRKLRESGKRVREAMRRQRLVVGRDGRVRVEDR